MTAALISQEKSDEAAAANPNNLTQFRVKKDMRLAPTYRTEVSVDKMTGIDKILADSDVGKDNLYIAELKSGARKAEKTGKHFDFSLKGVFK